MLLLQTSHRMLQKSIINSSLLYRFIICSSIQKSTTNRNFATKNYDKTIKLKPINVEYRYDDSQFLKGPSWADEPYIRPTDDEIVELTRMKMEKEISNQIHMECDPESKPFSQVFEGNEDDGMFTKTERIMDEDGSIWKWVERLMPKQTLGPIREGSELIIPPKEPSKDQQYHIGRTRSRLYPIYLDYVVIDRDHKRYWQNRWDHMFNKYHTHILDRLDDIKWENNEKTIAITKVNQIQGNIWQFEHDCRQFIREHYNLDHVMSGVNEVLGSVQFKGDFVEGLTEFFRQKGF